MIKVNFKTYSDYVSDSVYQWDKNQVLQVSGLNITVNPEVHFTNAEWDKALVRQATLKDGVVSVNIPNSLLQSSLDIQAYIGVWENKVFKTIESIIIPVINRSKPSGYTLEYEDDEFYDFNLLENMLNNLITHNSDVSSNSELLDIRVGADGKTYMTAGGAVREQFKKLTADVKKLNDGALNISEDLILLSVESWLASHPEATTTIQDGSITREKIEKNFLTTIDNNYITPEMFGAKGDGVTDDTIPLLNAIKEGYQKEVKVVGNNKYYVKDGLTIPYDYKWGPGNLDLSLKTLIGGPNANCILRIAKGGAKVNVDYLLNEDFMNPCICGIIVASSGNKITCKKVEGCTIGLSFSNMNVNSFSDNNIKFEELTGQYSICVDRGMHVCDCTFEMLVNAPMKLDGDVYDCHFKNCLTTSNTSELFVIGGNFYNNILDFNGKLTHGKFQVRSGAKPSLTRPNRIVNGLRVNFNEITNEYKDFIYCNTANMAVTNDGKVAIWSDERVNMTQSLAYGAMYDPRKNPYTTLAKVLRVQSNSLNVVMISDDYGYERGALPEFIIPAMGTLSVQRERGEIVAKFTNHTGEDVLKRVVFLSETESMVI